MLQTQPSLLSLFACALYLLVAISAWWAGRTANAHKQKAWHKKAWVLIAAFFIVLIASRLLELEEFLRSELRGWLEAEELTENRRSIQGPLIAVTIVIFASALMFATYWVSKRITGRRNVAVTVAVAACCAMLATIAMRTVSLHSLDRLLNGPLKLNWVGDIGSSLVVLAAAIIYYRIVSGKSLRRG